MQFAKKGSKVKTMEKLAARGFTLVELVVVLMVLVALAGILLPQFSGMVARTHTSAASTNMAEINKAINLYPGFKNPLKGYPDKLDVPIDSSGALATTVLEAGGPPDMTVITLDANQIASLNTAGITTAYPLLNLATLTSGGLSATFSGNDLAHPVSYSGTSAKAVQMSDTRVLTEFGNSFQGAAATVPVPETYVIFGLNDTCTAIPSVMFAAPLHFDQVDPTVVYSRFFLVFAIPVTGSSNSFAARFIGARSDRNFPAIRAISTITTARRAIALGWLPAAVHLNGQAQTSARSETFAAKCRGSMKTERRKDFFARGALKCLLRFNCVQLLLNLGVR